mmetsp:Transcript_35248/g.69993  ORF Transcript_35248/g.69993 Transcript_35248/m.69993 type:complete len:140 (-) Transcript_35248:171-590(-)|eukprot:CAMPEP_0170403138 /NCGR_PEP_ID=MMETSP0117_2-20130122/25938_1 /TAXON_ID=400756 /ORGANISM="Durinskia baltica, Strain CSIRO CS-38" /LENGTH=139 /DNA_ID=CAMNT_0010660067 /DNA_START=51 /DNA_END=470 /DNA_ORIENTATION=+
MSTGIKVADEACQAFEKFKPDSNKTLFMIYKISEDKTTIVVEYTSTETDNFNTFLERLPENEGRYALYKMDYTTTDGRPATKIAFISWSPDAASVKPKMLYAGSKDALLKVLVGISVKVNATDMSEISEKIVQDACRKF